MKSNIEYLKESLSPKNEWIEAVYLELLQKDKVISELKDDIDKLKVELDEAESENDSLIDIGDLETIECGIGIIQYLKPDNLKLQMLMDDFKEKHSVHAL